ncbi:hypothetical protein C482_10172 [Natrialba chahannaoensis JCM 10990]|uniref:Uncharacterized protein n=1 Tax=Natrialba chahannaoensis JCM 10990 TaxID=1227492 RepID=M0AMS2_9EURY|nr:hypothetical protein C482_10172 [Natrialba chahannaoensis JCM 10990]
MTGHLKRMVTRKRAMTTRTALRIRMWNTLHVIEFSLNHQLKKLKLMISVGLRNFQVEHRLNFYKRLTG